MSFSISRKRFVQGIAQLLFYQTIMGNLDVANDYVTADRFPLGKFVIDIRLANQEGKLTEEQKERLAGIGFAMEEENQAWETMYLVAKRYISEHDGTMPKATERTSENMLLGAWVRKQQLLFYSLTKEKQEKLLQVGIQQEVRR